MVVLDFCLALLGHLLGELLVVVVVLLVLVSMEQAVKPEPVEQVFHH
jgi:hypothetical protein